ncbi:hypothetical protein WN48_00434 [Eufriesea mexicana]|nr:hypothetical protein WN48_00434 [Eufriesea mexicana]
MAVSVSFHRNVLLLSQVIQPSDEFKKHFREGMFDKPNTTGFLHTSHYLLTIYDSEHFKKLIEWPVICKKTEAKYRNNVKDYLTIISMENPDIGFPNILMSHLIHAGGSKFTIIMWKLSQVVLRRYIVRETTYNVAFAPQAGSKGNLAKKFLQKTNTKIDSNILNEYKSFNIIEKIFEKEQLITNLTHTAPVHPSIKKCLRDINNEEVIKKCLLQIEANTKNIKTAFNIIQTYLVDITKIISETQNNLCQKNIIQIHDDAVFPMSNMLMLSPLIKINMNYNDEESDLQKRLQLTPVEENRKLSLSLFAANSSMVSLPCSSKAHSTVLANATEKMHDISELNLDISTKSLCNLSAEFTTPKNLIIEQDKSENISKIEDIMNDFTNKADVLNICEIDVEIKNNIDNNIIETKQAKQNRRSIGDLVERYKKLLEASNRTPSPKIRYVRCKNK